MFAFKSKIKVESQVDFEIPEKKETQLKYWRKHPDLHGFMENLYRDKGGKSDSFNCVNVKLEKEDIDKLALSIIDENLPNTSGFFFGQSSNDEKKEDLDFCKEAISAINEGYTIWYTSWW